MNIKDDELIPKAKTSLYWALALAIVLSVAYFVWFWVIHRVPPSKDPSSWGTFGDFIGGVMNPIVALLALYWLTQSISIQKQELQDTRRVLESQSRANEVKRFEDTFFALLAEHNALLGQLKYVTNNKTGLDKVYRDIFQQSKKIDSARKTLQIEDKFVGHYFRLLYQILKFIALKCPETFCTLKDLRTHEQQTLPSDSEKFYSNILRSALDAKTSQLLAVNCCCSNQEDSYFAYRRLIERYAFLEHMPFVVYGHDPSELLLSACKYYDKSALGNNDYLSELRKLG